MHTSNGACDENFECYQIDLYVFFYTHHLINSYLKLELISILNYRNVFKRIRRGYILYIENSV